MKDGVENVAVTLACKILNFQRLCSSMQSKVLLVMWGVDVLRDGKKSEA